jgi:tRNA(fMet)-specific endonuclease VapC
MIDTDIFSFMLRKDKAVLENVQKYQDKYKKLNISIITYYEILKGTPISQADILIAGIAKSKNLFLVTNNIAHFERIPDLVIENWHTKVYS